MTDTAVDPGFQQYRAELTRHCARVLGSAADAEDAVQETMVRAWRSFDRFEGRGTVRAWLYTIATRVCIDMIRAESRRPRPAAVAVDDVVVSGMVMRGDGSTTDDPADLVARRQAVQGAFYSALGNLPPRQRAVLVLREVLRCRSDEIAEELGMSPAAVNSALQRARSALPAAGADGGVRPPTVGDAQHAVLSRYVDALERRDASSLLALVHDDASAGRPGVDRQALAGLGVAS